jgi:MraZ protein
MWYGEYFHSLDEKDRFILPAKFRAKLKQLKNKTFYLTRGLDGCLFIFDYQQWHKFEEKFKQLSFTKKQARYFNRLYFSGAQEIKFDSQGRVTLPDYLKQFADIKRDIVIIGVADRIEVWSKLRWEKFYAENRENFEQIAEDIIE